MSLSTQARDLREYTDRQLVDHLLQVHLRAEDAQAVVRETKRACLASHVVESGRSLSLADTGEFFAEDVSTYVEEKVFPLGTPRGTRFTILSVIHAIVGRS